MLLRFFFPLHSVLFSEPGFLLFIATHANRILPILPLINVEFLFLLDDVAISTSTLFQIFHGFVLICDLLLCLSLLLHLKLKLFFRLLLLPLTILFVLLACLFCPRRYFPNAILALAFLALTLLIFREAVERFSHVANGAHELILILHFGHCRGWCQQFRPLSLSLVIICADRISWWRWGRRLFRLGVTCWLCSHDVLTFVI
mmetsp:Transcript_8376/g.16964  ORF Transcript_8376/g.16964 Transcript_8376/m.16964 type:complete len:202 (-) Transcript_8376:104-709(-)